MTLLLLNNRLYLSTVINCINEYVLPFYKVVLTGGACLEMVIDCINRQIKR